MVNISNKMENRTGIFTLYVELLKEKPYLRTKKTIKDIAKTCKLPMDVIYKELGLVENELVSGDESEESDGNDVSVKNVNNVSTKRNTVGRGSNNVTATENNARKRNFPTENLVAERSNARQETQVVTASKRESRAKYLLRNGADTNKNDQSIETEIKVENTLVSDNIPEKPKVIAEKNKVPIAKDVQITFVSRKNLKKFSDKLKAAVLAKIYDIGLTEKELTVAKARRTVNADPDLPNFKQPTFHKLLRILRVSFNKVTGEIKLATDVNKKKTRHATKEKVPMVSIPLLSIPMQNVPDVSLPFQDEEITIVDIPIKREPDTDVLIVESPAMPAIIPMPSIDAAEIQPQASSSEVQIQKHRNTTNRTRQGSLNAETITIPTNRKSISRQLSGIQNRSGVESIPKDSPTPSNDVLNPEKPILNQKVTVAIPIMNFPIPHVPGDKKVPSKVCLYKPCRICMKNTPDTLNIFSPVFWSSEIAPISDMVMKYANTSVSANDKLPHLICKSCLNNLKAAEKFTFICENSDRMFRRNFRKKKDIYIKIDKTKSALVGKLGDASVIQTGEGLPVTPTGATQEVPVDGTVAKRGPGRPCKSSVIDPKDTNAGNDKNINADNDKNINSDNDKNINADNDKDKGMVDLLQNLFQHNPNMRDMLTVVVKSVMNSEPIKPTDSVPNSDPNCSSTRSTDLITSQSETPAISLLDSPTMETEIISTDAARDSEMNKNKSRNLNSNQIMPSTSSTVGPALLDPGSNRNTNVSIRTVPENTANNQPTLNNVATETEASAPTRKRVGPLHKSKRGKKTKSNKATESVYLVVDSDIEDTTNTVVDSDIEDTTNTFVFDTIDVIDSDTEDTSANRVVASGTFYPPGNAQKNTLDGLSSMVQQIDKIGIGINRNKQAVKKPRKPRSTKPKKTCNDAQPHGQSSLNNKGAKKQKRTKKSKENPMLSGLLQSRSFLNPEPSQLGPMSQNFNRAMEPPPYYITNPSYSHPEYVHVESWMGQEFCEPTIPHIPSVASAYSSQVDPSTGMFFVTDDPTSETSTIYLCTESELNQPVNLVANSHVESTGRTGLFSPDNQIGNVDAGYYAPLTAERQQMLQCNMDNGPGPLPARTTDMSNNILKVKNFSDML